MSARSLADGHQKLTILTTKPADPANPTITELNAGIDFSCNVLASDFTWSAADSDKVNEKSLCQEGNANAIAASNYTAGLTIFREFDESTGAVDPVGDACFQALKTKGTRAWGYLREIGKPASQAWAGGDEIKLGLEFLTDNPQRPSQGGGYIKDRVPLEPQVGWPYTAAKPIPATGATAGTPGTFTPVGATVPADLAALAGVVADPATAWTTGQHVVLGDASKAHWTSSAWASGEAS